MRLAGDLDGESVLAQANDCSERRMSVGADFRIVGS